MTTEELSIAISARLEGCSITPDTRPDMYAKARRDILREHEICINGPTHGKATHGRLCAPCRITHRGSRDTARAARTSDRHGITEP